MEIPPRWHRALDLDLVERGAWRRRRTIEPWRLGEAVALAFLRRRRLRPADFVGAGREAIVSPASDSSPSIGVRSFMRSATTWITPDSLCNLPVTPTKRAPSTIGRRRSNTFGQTIDIGDAGLVLQRHEDDALGGAGPLAHQHEARDGHSSPPGDGKASLRRISRRARSRRRNEAGCAFSESGGGDSRRPHARRAAWAAARVRSSRSGATRQTAAGRPCRRPGEPARRPQRLPPVEPERAEGVGVGEPFQHGRAQAAAQP